jgi:paraquat-inducible protein B
MNANTPPEPDGSEIPQPVIRSGKRRFSIVWLVPVVALLIGGWLIYKAVTEKGPEITIAFSTAEGLEAGKTKIKCKDVEIGQVQEISLSKDLAEVIVKAQLVKEAESYLSENSRFWVVRARVSASSVTGLGTVFSGAYIDIDPGPPGKKTHRFKGLEDPPIVTTWERGRHFILQADRKGSLDIGSPVYYRQIQVGRIAAYNLAQGGTGVLFKVFIKEPYPDFVRKDTRFWNASGLDMKIDAQGIQIDSESFVSMLVGGVAFDVIEGMGVASGEAAPEDEPFTLYPSRSAAQERIYSKKNYFVLLFDESVRGLSPGAPLEFRGIEVGKVVDIKSEFDFKRNKVKIPVIVAAEPERISFVGKLPEGVTRETFLDYLVEKGLRAQLRTGSLLTGQLYVALDLFPDAKPATLVRNGRYGYPEFPTTPTPFEEIGSKLTNLVAKIDKIPIEQIGSDLRDTMRGAKRLATSPEIAETVKSLNAAVKELHLLTADLRTRTAPEFNATLQQAQASLAATSAALQSDSPVQIRLKVALEELAAAARSLRALADYLERQPESILTGKEPKQ